MEAIGSPGTRVTDDCEPPWKCWGSNLGPQEDSSVTSLAPGPLKTSQWELNFNTNCNRGFQTYLYQDLHISLEIQIGFEHSVCQSQLFPIATV